MVGKVEVSIVRNELAGMVGRVKSKSTGTFLTFSKLHIEYVEETIAVNAVGSVEKGSGEGTIADSFVELTPLVVLVDQVGDGLPAEDPVTGEQIGLEDSRLEEAALVAF